LDSTSFISVPCPKPRRRRSRRRSGTKRRQGREEIEEPRKDEKEGGKEGAKGKQKLHAIVVTERIRSNASYRQRESNFLWYRVWTMYVLYRVMILLRRA
jgi:hypothetical protein